jgi:hypothetical protein
MGLVTWIHGELGSTTTVHEQPVDKVTSPAPPEAVVVMEPELNA